MALLLSLVIVFVAGFLTGVTGFGFSVLSVPLLLLLFPPHEVVVVVLCLVPVTSAVLLLAPELRGQVRGGTFAALTGFSVVGLPAGVLLFERVDPMWVTGLMGFVLLAYATYALLGATALTVHRRWAAPSGILGGILATSTGLSGPAVAMYVHGSRISPREQTATMSAYVAVISVLGLGLLAVHGAVSGQDVQHAVRLAAGAVTGTLVGRWWASRRHETLERVTVVALALMGVWTVGRSLVWLTRGALG